jgi:hypothetical protein
LNAKCQRWLRPGVPVARDLALQREDLQRRISPRALWTYRDFAAATAKKKSARILVTGFFPQAGSLSSGLLNATEPRLTRRSIVLIVKYHQARRLSSSRAASRSPRPPGITLVSFYSSHMGFHPAFVRFYHMILMYFRGTTCYIALGSKNIIIIIIN